MGDFQHRGGAELGGIHYRPDSLALPLRGLMLRRCGSAGKCEVSGCLLGAGLVRAGGPHSGAEAPRLAEAEASVKERQKASGEAIPGRTKPEAAFPVAMNKPEPDRRAQVAGYIAETAPPQALRLNGRAAHCVRG